jgi:hypothetical protein
MQIPSTYGKFVLTQFNKKHYNSHLKIYIYKLYYVLLINFVIFYFDVYISIDLDKIASNF